jgi:divalent metal cation (Fe/Co/Zn/Cd) transporter
MYRIPLAIALLIAGGFLIWEAGKEIVSGNIVPHLGWSLVLACGLVAAAIYLIIQTIKKR